MLQVFPRASRIAAGTAFLMSMLLANSGEALRADDPKPAPPAAEPAEQPADPFEVPKASDPMSVQIFIGGLIRAFQTRGAEFRNKEGSMDYLNRMDKSLAELQGRKLAEDPAILTANVRMQVLDVLVDLEDPTAIEREMALIKVLKASDSPALQGMGKQFELSASINSMETMTPEQRTEVVQKVADGLKGEPLAGEAVSLAQQAGDMLKDLGQGAEAAAAYNLFAKYLEARKEERLAPLIENFRGSARFAALLGHPIEIKGTTVDGQPFDITQYKGKVVLIDFWATWCGPCIGELPNVKHHYDLYHAKGFEVVGVSLDDDADRLKEFLAEEKIGWVTLFPADETQRGWENPLARHYGISGIPTVILVNQEGNVVNLEARGPTLGEELEKLLGPPEPQPAPPASPKP